MTAGILKEPQGENRVSLLPEQAATLIKKGITVLVEDGAGDGSFANNDTYIDKGVKVVSRSEVLQQSDMVFSIQLLTPSDESLLKPNAVLLGVFQPLFQFKTMQSLFFNNDE